MCESCAQPELNLPVEEEPPNKKMFKRGVVSPGNCMSTRVTFEKVVALTLMERPCPVLVGLLFGHLVPTVVDICTINYRNESDVGSYVY